jgi:hypothetical protein
MHNLRFQDHSGPAAVWGVINAPMPILREISDINSPKIDQT